MSGTHVLILLFSFILYAVVGAEEVCDPVCVGADTFIADPYDCHSYYYCISPGTPSGPYTCSDDLIFDTTKHPDHNDPKPPCKADTTPPCKATCENPTCQVACRNTFDIIVDTNNCTLFYLCISDGENFKTHQDECPSDRPWFNGADCTSHREGCCDVCHPSCEGKVYGDQIPDPDDCTKYFVCLGTGPDAMSEEQTCFSGHFDIEQNKCVSGEECTPLCGGTTTTTGGNTETEATDATTAPPIF